VTTVYEHPEYLGMMRRLCEIQDPERGLTNDTQRMVIADWLDEHGESERAEFIRCQCELARMSPCPATIHYPLTDTPREHPYRRGGPPVIKAKEPCGWCPVCTLRKRERELLPHRSLLVGLPGKPQSHSLPQMMHRFWADGKRTAEIHYFFGRGFPSSIALSAEHFRLHERKLLWCMGKCIRCRGSGSYYVEMEGFSTTCADCSGSGEVPPTDECEKCHGVGMIEYRDKNNVIDHYICGSCANGRTGYRRGSGRVPRPFTTQQPITDRAIDDGAGPRPGHSRRGGRLGRDAGRAAARERRAAVHLRPLAESHDPPTCRGVVGVLDIPLWEKI
jgi:uncharacterized protein (TIGR02996 family)